MSSIKKHLKAARECIANKSYRDALVHCKEALAEDKNSYDAYVFVGKAAFHLSEHQQAEAAYQRAIDLQGSNITAWQGLAELYSEIGRWEGVANAYRHIIELAQQPQDEALKAKLPMFLRRQAEAASRAGSIAEAEHCWRQLLGTAPAGERLELLCRLADVQLQVDRLELEQRVAERLQEAAAMMVEVNEANIRQAVEGEWAEEALELETDHASNTLREIIAQTPPTPLYAPYHEAYLRRLRKSVYAAPPASMERHHRRIAVLHFCKTMMEGHAADQAGGCCSAYAFETALAMLEVENDVCPPSHPHHHAEDAAATAAAAHQAVFEATPLQPTDSQVIGIRLVHAFPWTASASVQSALCLRRRPVFGSLCRTSHHGGQVAPEQVTDLNTQPQSRPQVPRKAQPTCERRKYMIRELLMGLRRGVSSAAGWLAAADLLLQEGAAEAALDAAKQGLKYVAHRDMMGKERMEQAALLLRLLAGQALTAMGTLPEAEALLSALASSVSDGLVTFGELAGLGPMNIKQQTSRYLAQVALASGDRSTARQRYEELIARDMLGRSAVLVEHWAHAEYGWMMFEDGDLETARKQLELGLKAVEHTEVSELPSKDQVVAEYRLKLAQVYWALGGELRMQQGPGTAHGLLLSAAVVEGPSQAAVFTWLGHWYAQVTRDGLRARKCYQRALVLDPKQDGAGDGLVGVLLGDGETSLSMSLCQEMSVKEPEAHWAWRHLAALQLRGGDNEAATATFQRAIRGEPGNAELWEGLAAAYQALGRHTAALKSFTRALELQPGRLYSLLQSGALHYQLGQYNEALAAYRKALAADPRHPVALLGAAEVLLASAHMQAAGGAYGIAAQELAEGIELAQQCTSHYGNLQGGWKLLGDILLQHAAVTPHTMLQQLQQAPPGEPAKQAALEAVAARIDAMRAARRTYLHALHLDPSQGLVWGDVANTLHQEAVLTGLHPELHSPQQVSELRKRGQRFVRGALRLEPASDWLWACAGNVAQGDAAQQEYCWSRALQLNPKSAATWASLGRLYAQHGAGLLAHKCFDQARSHEPTLVAVWEAMGHLAGTQSQAVGDANFCDMLEAYDHAALLGGNLESRLGFVAAAVLKAPVPQHQPRSISSTAAAAGEVYAAARKCVNQQPLLPAAHNAHGLAAEARGSYQEAADAYITAFALLNGSSAGSADGSQQATYSMYAADGTPGGVLLAVRLNLARALVKAGNPTKAVEEFEQLKDTEAMGRDPNAWMAYAAALKQLQQPAEATSALQSAVGIAATAPAHVRLGCAEALVQHLVEAQEWDQAYAVVLAHGLEVPEEPEAAAAALQLWLALLAGAVVAGLAELGADVSMALKSWAAAQKELDMSKVLAAVELLQAVKHAGSGQMLPAMRRASRAVHACPWNQQARLQLATYAVACSPTYAQAAMHAAPQDPPLKAPVAAWPLPEGHSNSLHIPVGFAVRAQGLLASLPEKSLCKKLDAEIVSLTKLVHQQPHSIAGWYLLALVSVQAAAASGGQCRLYRQALMRCKVAVARVQAALRLEEAAAGAARSSSGHASSSTSRRSSIDAASAAAAAAATAANNSVASSLPIMQMYAATQRPSEPTANNHQGPDYRAAGSGDSARVVQLLATMSLQLLAAMSECHLHSRIPGCQQRAKDMATDALRWALQHNLDSCLAHRQLGRVAVAQRDPGNAEHAYSQATKNGDLPSLVEYASLLVDVGQAAQAEQLLSSSLQTKGFTAAPWERSLLGAAQLGRVHVLLGLGELEQAHELVSELVSEQKLPDSALAAAHTLQASSALGLAKSAGGEEAKKKLVLEARWAAASALKEASPGPQPVTQLLLGQAEVARGKHDKAAEALNKALQSWSWPEPAELLGQLAQLSSDAPGKRRLLAYAVHANPWHPDAWLQLSAVATAHAG